MVARKRRQSQRPKRKSKRKAPAWSEQIGRIRSAVAAILAPPYPELETDKSPEAEAPGAGAE